MIFRLNYNQIFGVVQAERLVMRSFPPSLKGKIGRVVNSSLRQVLTRFTVYPCAYREHPLKLDPFVTLRGLSLCIQGTLVSIYDIVSDERFIPVHTGNMRVLPATPPILAGLSLCIQGTCD